MRNLIYSSLAVLCVFIASCGGEKKEEKKNTQDKSLVEKIQEAEKGIDLNNPDKQKLINLISLYRMYADSLPKDPKSPQLLLKASDFYAIIGQHTQKIHLYKELLDKFPDFKDADMVMYLYASALDSDIDAREEAKKYYQLYIEKYPKSPYVNDAKSRLTTIDSLSFSELQDMIINKANPE